MTFMSHIRLQELIKSFRKNAKKIAQNEKIEPEFDSEAELQAIANGEKFYAPRGKRDVFSQETAIEPNRLDCLSQNSPSFDENNYFNFICVLCLTIVFLLFIKMFRNKLYSR